MYDDFLNGKFYEYWWESFLRFLYDVQLYIEHTFDRNALWYDLDFLWIKQRAII